MVTIYHSKRQHGLADNQLVQSGHYVNLAQSRLTVAKTIIGLSNKALYEAIGFIIGAMTVRGS